MTKTTKLNPLDTARQGHQEAEQHLATARNTLARHHADLDTLTETIQTTGQRPEGRTLSDLHNAIAETELIIAGLTARLHTATDQLAHAVADDAEAKVRDRLAPLRTVDQDNPHVRAIANAVAALIADAEKSNSILTDVLNDLAAHGETFEYDKFNPTPHNQRMWLHHNGGNRKWAAIGLTVDGLGSYAIVNPANTATDAVAKALSKCGIVLAAPVATRKTQSN